MLEQCCQAVRSIAAIFSFWLAASQLWAAAPPNVIIILADDVGYGDLECHGNPLIKTPTLNQLQQESAVFERFFVDPTCSPSRAALISGRWPFEVGVNHTIAGRSILRPGVQTIAKSFQQAGYRTGIFGKWHLGDHFPSRPQENGFAETFIHLGGGIGQAPDYWGNSYFNPWIYHNERWSRSEGFCTTVFVDQLITWSRQQKDRPFFAYLPFNVAHTPWTVAPEWRQKLIDRGVPPKLAAFYALIEHMDNEIGRLLKAVDRKNTIVVFASDNGTASKHSFNAGMKGRKGSTDEGGVRVPGWISWSGTIDPNLSTDELAGHIDLFPTLAELAKVSIKNRDELDGTSWANWLLGKAQPITNRTWFTHRGRWSGEPSAEQASQKDWAVRTKRYRLVPPALYDLISDPGQKQNIAKDNQKVVADLTERYQKWWKTQAPYIEEPVRIVTGHPDHPKVQLYAHDWYPSTTFPKAPGADKTWDQVQVKNLLKAEAEGKKRPLISGRWRLDVATTGDYQLTLRRLPEEAPLTDQTTWSQIPPGQVTLRTNSTDHAQTIVKADANIPLTRSFTKGFLDLEAYWQSPDQDHSALGFFYLTIEKLN